MVAGAALATPTTLTVTVAITRLERAEPYELEFQAVVDALQSFSTILTLSDADNQLIRANAAAIAFIGRPEHDVIGHSVMEFLTPASREEVTANAIAGSDTGPYGEHELEFVRPDGSTVWGRVRTIRLKDRAGQTALRISVVEDITAHRATEVAQRTAQALLDAAIVALPVVFATFDTDLRLTLVVGGHEHGEPPLNQSIGKTVFEITDNLAVIEALQRALTGRESTSRSVINGEDYLAVNAPIRDAAGAVVGVISVTSNVTTEVLVAARGRRAEELALFIARHDQLTGLLTRSALTEHLSAKAASGHGARALMILDLDDFNAINDSMGHAVGDAVLLEVASRVAEAFPGFLVARYGGDQFAVVAPFIAEPREAVAAAERVRVMLEPDVEVSGQTLRITACVGLAMQEVHEPSSTLIRNADSALSHAKDAGHAQYRVYDAEMRRQTQDRLLMQDGLRVALSAGQLRVAYQPIVQLWDRCIVGAEALLRWDHPERGPISPSEFIPIAEQGGLIVPIGEWVMNTACQDVLALHQELGVYISVNASTRQLVGGGFAAWVDEALARAGLPPEALTIEVTEGALLDDMGPIRRAFDELRSRGVRVAIDDFGTGFSSLARLQRLPVDVIKLDRAFVTGLDARPEARGMAAAILQLSVAIGASVVAEGVETEAEAAALLDLGYTVGQGYLFARPMPIGDLTTLVAQSPVFDA